MSYLVEKSHTLEELITFGLGKFEVLSEQQRKYLIDIISTNHLFYSTNRTTLHDLLWSVIKHKPTADSFMDWLEATVPVYLKDGEAFYSLDDKHPNVIWDKVNSLEKRIDVLYDLFEELLKKIDNN